MMNASEKMIARLIFRNKILSADGQAYEDLFTAVMAQYDKTFRPIKPQGQFGDRKNDGYIPSKGRYFQVFAPEDINKSSAEAVKKSRRDFNGLKSYWDGVSPVRHYTFVMNDKYNGSFPTIEEDLKAIKTENNLCESDILLAKDLEDLFFQLSEDGIISIVGFIPDPMLLQTPDYSIMNEVVTHVLTSDTRFVAEQNYTAPDFEEKIKFNGLGNRPGNLLRAASYQSGELKKIL